VSRIAPSGPYARQLDRWRRGRLREFFPSIVMAGGFQISGTGVVITGNGVTVATHDTDPCCCTSAGAPCVQCSTSTTPKFLTVTVTGSSLCTGSPVTSGLHNGTFECTQKPTLPCTWELVIPGTYGGGYTKLVCSAGFVTGPIRWDVGVGYATATSFVRHTAELVSGTVTNCMAAFSGASFLTSASCAPGVSQEGFGGSFTCTPHN
jgi:hypothetical protein